MVKLSKNSLGKITGNDNIVIQIIDTNGKVVSDSLESILTQISNNSIKKITALERKIDNLKKKTKKKQKRFNNQANELLALKAELEQKKELLKTKQQLESEILKNINGLDLREIDPNYAKAYEFFIQGMPVEALNLLDRTKLIQARKRIENENKELIRAWQLRLTLLETSSNSNQEDLDECYVTLSELDSSFSNLISAANHFLKTNHFKKAQFYCNEASKNIKYAHELAFALNKLGVLQSGTSRYKLAHKNFIEAIKIYEYLIGKNPNSYESHLAVVYSYLGQFYSVLGKNKKAIIFLDKAMDIQENLLQKDDDDSKYSLAYTLGIAGSVQTETNKIKEAKDSFDRALELMRNLDKKSNGLYLPDIALICHNYAHALVQRTNEYNKALLLIKEAIRIRRNLEKSTPRLYSPLLQTSLYVKSQILEFQELPESEVKRIQIQMNLGARFRSWFSFLRY